MKYLAVVVGAVLAQSPLLAQAQSATNPAPTLSSAPAKAAAHAGGRKAAPARAQSSLDLKAPPLSHIYPRAQLQYILAVDAADADDAQEVSVKGEKYLMPVPASQLQAIPWALMHPADAWRVFTPIESP